MRHDRKYSRRIKSKSKVMLIKKFHLSWFLKLWYRIIFKEQYFFFKDSGQINLFWNIVSWFHFFQFKMGSKYSADLYWSGIGNNKSTLYIEKFKKTIRIISFNSVECQIIQIENETLAYKYIDGEIYQITYESDVE